MKVYKESKETRRKKREAANRFWAKRKEKELEQRKSEPESKVVMLTNMTGGNTEKFLKAMRFLQSRGVSLSEETLETLSYVRATEPELYHKYF